MSKNTDSTFESVLSEAVQLAQSEVSNLASRNSIRWNKGIAANQAIDLAKQLPKDTFKGSPQKYVRERMVDGLTQAGHAGADKMLSANELSITTGAAKAWLDLRGVETPYGKDGALVADIAIDKAYALRGIKGYEGASDALLDFAGNYDEATCKNLRKLTKEANIKGEAVAVLISDIEKLANSTKLSVSHLIKDRLSEYADDDAIASMRVDKALLEGDWNDLRTHMGAIDQFLGYAVEEATGMTTNTRALERVISYFLPRDFGYNALLQLMIENGEMTKGQAETFLRGLADDGDTDDFTGDEEVEKTLAEIDAEYIPSDLPDDPLVEEIKAATADLEPIADDLEPIANDDDDDFDFDDDPVYDGDAEDSKPWE